MYCLWLCMLCLCNICVFVYCLWISMCCMLSLCIMYVCVWCVCVWCMCLMCVWVFGVGGCSMCMCGVKKTMYIVSMIVWYVWLVCVIWVWHVSVCVYCMVAENTFCVCLMSVLCCVCQCMCVSSALRICVCDTYVLYRCSWFWCIMCACPDCVFVCAHTFVLDAFFVDWVWFADVLFATTMCMIDFNPHVCCVCEFFNVVSNNTYI